jgi:hypothetical protein
VKSEGRTTAAYTDLCYGCKRFVEITWTESGTQRPFCQPCVDSMPPTVDQINMLLLLAPWSPIGPMFKAGDRVEARTGAMILDGVGTVEEMSISLEHGGTPIYPTFRVTITRKAYPEAPDEAWYTEVCLTHLDDGGGEG